MSRLKGGERLERTQISLGKAERLLLQRLAASKGASMAQVIREAIHHYAQEQAAGVLRDKMLEIVGLGESGNPRSSVEHDKVIYG